MTVKSVLADPWTIELQSTNNTVQTHTNYTHHSPLGSLLITAKTIYEPKNGWFSTKFPGFGSAQGASSCSWCPTRRRCVARSSSSASHLPWAVAPIHRAPGHTEPSHWRARWGRWWTHCTSLVDSWIFSRCNQCWIVVECLCDISSFRMWWAEHATTYIYIMDVLGRYL